MAENLNDIKLIRCLVDLYLSSQSYPTRYVSYRADMGGGSALADVLENMAPIPQKGIVLCDRDHCGDAPPFKAGTTGLRAFDTAKRIGLLGDAIGWSQTAPMFCFATTWGRTVENFIGPHLADVYFDKNARRAERRAVSDAFPNFPKLGGEEWDVWRRLNLKDGTPDLTDVLTALRGEYGTPPQGLLPYLRKYPFAKLPNDTMPWIFNHSAGSQWSSLIRKAVSEDFKNAQYHNAVSLIANQLKDVAAGDDDAIRL